MTHPLLGKVLPENCLPQLARYHYQSENILSFYFICFNCKQSIYILSTKQQSKIRKQVCSPGHTMNEENKKSANFDHQATKSHLNANASSKLSLQHFKNTVQEILVNKIFKS